MLDPSIIYPSDFQQVPQSLHNAVLKNITYAPLWPIDHLFDSQVNDPFNFDLHDNAVSVLSTIFTFISILFAFDISFRLVVRANPTVLSSYGLIRHKLLYRFSNPLTWFPRPTSVPPREPPSSIANTEPELSRLRGFPERARVSVIICGLLLVLFQFILVFLATSQNSGYSIDKRQIPSFEVKDTIMSPILPQALRYAIIRPITSRRGFSSRANMALFTDIVFSSHAQYFGQIAGVSFQLSDFGLDIWVFTNRTRMILKQHFSIVIPNGTKYNTRPTVSNQTVVKVMTQIFARNSIETIRKPVTTMLVQGAWTTLFYVDLTNANVPSVPAKILQEARTRFRTMDEGGLRWGFYLGAVARSAFSLSGKGRAGQVNYASGPFLDEYEGALVVKNRPWLSVGGCMIMCGVLLVTHAFVGIVLGWKGEIDDLWLWKGVLLDIEDISELSKKPDHIIVV